MIFESVIGLEIHVELKTRTKMFCSCLNDPDEKHPDINICPVCMGHPGALPAANQEAVKKTIMVGLSLGGEVQKFSRFDRKNYFYPDLPKGYQITQYEYPLVKGGYLDIKEIKNSPPEADPPLAEKLKTQNPIKRIRIRRIHLEEDTGRLLHDRETGSSMVDFNRAGVPLMELVTEPDFRSGEEIKVFGGELQRILRYIGASDADMEKGEMRVEVNISLREIVDNRGQNADRRGNVPRHSASGLRDSAALGTKVEIKNINSFKYAADAVDYEIKRQSSILEKGEKIIQETRGWNEKKQETFSQRVKEESHDYRYFPEPDLPPLEISDKEIEALKAALPELPEQKMARFINEYALAENTAGILVKDKDLAEYFERTVSEVREWEKSTPEPAKKSLLTLAANFLTGDFLKLLYDTSTRVSETLITPENFGEFLTYLAEDKISSSAAKTVFEEMFRTGGDPSEIINSRNLLQFSDESELAAVIQKIIDANPKPVADYKKGTANALQFLAGQVMKETKGRANPAAVQKLLTEKLKE